MKRENEEERGYRGAEAVRSRILCPVCGRACRENAVDMYGEVVGCEKCVSFEDALTGLERSEGYEEG